MKERTNALVLERMTLATCLGLGLDAHAAALAAGRSGLCPCDLPHVGLETLIGEVDGLEETPLPRRLAAYDCRNNRLAWRGLQADGFADAVLARRAEIGPRRIGVFVGSSTSGIDRTERAYRERRDDGPLPDWFDYRHTHNAFSPAAFVQDALGLEGVAQVVATACSSSAKAFAAAKRHLQAGLCDAAVVGGVDSLCQTTLYGFNALELVAREPCRPWDPGRQGISLAEAAGFALVALRPRGAAGGGFAVLGHGESSDAHHMSAPHPEGAGAARAMRASLDMAGLPPDAIGYVNLHGTGTLANDEAEDRAVLAALGPRVPCRSTKGLTGHALGAAGIVELVLLCLGLEERRLPPMPTTRTIDAALKANVRTESEPCRTRFGLTNAFGFGGSNCALVVGAGA
ncbi:MAG: beta-ketoacyl-ACP synthase [Geminicoccaceae bacterium]|nr:beta-ketoacyl-ACP synthase [Geminicoccaceae bacterium]